MKQFSLEEFKKNPNRKVVAENGRSARIICTDAKGRFPVIALVFDVENDYEDIYFYTQDGECSDISDGPMNLFFAPEKKEGYINLYRSKLGIVPHQTSFCVLSNEDAEREAAKYPDDFIATAKVTWEE